MSKAILETNPGVGRFWELLGGDDLGVPCSWVLAALGPGLKLKHSPGSLTTSSWASDLLAMTVAMKTVGHGKWTGKTE